MLEIFKAFGDENRLRILNLLLQGPLCVCELEFVLQMSQTNVSRHLAKLKQAKVVQSFKQGQWMNYQMDPVFLTQEAKLVAYLQEQFSQGASFQEDLAALLNHQVEWEGCMTPSRKYLQEKLSHKGAVQS
ncbi:ArsR/SmtB family transcription factor [Anaeroarcus burkinensis]|uniref:ArsR/SmtB family transcription factor n=1 Tax=Anaeroarcus burkinensis TaxID=82376 RepID=UPI000401EC03|nr:metalloregulator ArsR/SmtB family transcription factor [Anaeroarcus burkinensis]